MRQQFSFTIAILALLALSTIHVMASSQDVHHRWMKGFMNDTGNSTAFYNSRSSAPYCCLPSKFSMEISLVETRFCHGGDVCQRVQPSHNESRATIHYNGHLNATLVQSHSWHSNSSLSIPSRHGEAYQDIYTFNRTSCECVTTRTPTPPVQGYCAYNATAYNEEKKTVGPAVDVVELSLTSNHSRSNITVHPLNQNVGAHLYGGYHGDESGRTDTCIPISGHHLNATILEQGAFMNSTVTQEFSNFKPSVSNYMFMVPEVCAAAICRKE
eukprot:gb/GECH01012973.1/.p1 GENE.gb/GECH01012973.1/~~gb/GECH01012973.1/.p1  ORF type:complete len:270 (+),score=45.75 gb/GECH01012973.1/:1-810(+)